MRVTSCPDCGEAVELPLSRDNEDLEVTCPTCGLSGPVEEWGQYEPEDNDTLLGRPLGNATISPGMPKTWALRMEQLEEIRDVVVELQLQIRLLRQALDELNDDLPEKIKRWFDSWHGECLPTQPAPAPAVTEQPARPPPPAKTKAGGEKAKRATLSASPSQGGLW